MSEFKDFLEEMIRPTGSRIEVKGQAYIFLKRITWTPGNYKDSPFRAEAMLVIPEPDETVLARSDEPGFEETEIFVIEPKVLVKIVRIKKKESMKNENNAAKN